MNRPPRSPLPVLLLASLFVAACGTETTELPAGLGPVALTTDLAPARRLRVGAPPPARSRSAPRGRCSRTPATTSARPGDACPTRIATVWQALQIPTGVDLGFWPERNESDCEARRDVEPGYAVSFITKEIPHGGIQSHYTFDVTWRADVTQGTSAAPTEVKMLYGKTAGTTEVPKILGSIVFTADPARPGWTRIDMVRQLNTNGHSDEPEKLQNWLQGFYDGLQTQLSTGALLPRYCNLP